MSHARGELPNRSTASITTRWTEMVPDLLDTTRRQMNMAMSRVASLAVSWRSGGISDAELGAVGHDLRAWTVVMQERLDLIGLLTQEEIQPTTELFTRMSLSNRVPGATGEVRDLNAFDKDRLGTRQCDSARGPAKRKNGGFSSSDEAVRHAINLGTGTCDNS